MAERGWDARGLLQPLWNRYEGGREALAAAVGTSAPTLSSINTGKRRLGHKLGARLAAALEVSILELGAPEEDADDRAHPLVDRLAKVEAELTRMSLDLLRLGRRVVALEKRVPQNTQRGRVKTS